MPALANRVVYITSPMCLAAWFWFCFRVGWFWFLGRLAVSGGFAFGGVWVVVFRVPVRVLFCFGACFAAEKHGASSSAARVGCYLDIPFLPESALAGVR